MENKDKTKEELIDEIKLLQMRIIQLETRDVEEKKQQVRIDHEKLQDALQLLRKGREESLNSLDGLAYVSDMKTYETLFVNKYGKKIWGDFTGKPCWQNLQTGQNGPCSFCTNDRLLQSDGTPAEVYVWEFQNTVTERWYECRDSAILWPDERMVRLEIATDITERKKAEEAEKREQAINKAIIDSIPGAFYMLDENGRYVRSNAYQRDEILGKSEELMAGTNAIETIHPDDREMIGSKISSVLKDGRREIVEGRVLLRGGPEYRWLLMTGQQMMVDARPFLVGIGIDITERKKADAILRKSKEDADAASKAKSEFLTNIAHDFRTPMHAIMGFSDHFRSEHLTAKQKKYADIINEKSKGLLILIEELLDVSRLDAGKLKLRSIDFDLKESVLEVVKAGTDNLMGKEVTLVCSIEEGFPQIKGDKVRFGQVLTNLIDNAIKYTDKGKVLVGVIRQLENCPANKCRVRVSVKDCGLGIPKDKQEQIFEAYTRFQEFDGTRERGGVGLGLYITKTLVELMGGTISVVSEVGVGSEFIIVLDLDLAETGN